VRVAGNQTYLGECSDQGIVMPNNRSVMVEGTGDGTTDSPIIDCQSKGRLFLFEGLSLPPTPQEAESSPFRFSNPPPCKSYCTEASNCCSGCSIDGCGTCDHGKKCVNYCRCSTLLSATSLQTARTARTHTEQPAAMSLSQLLPQPLPLPLPPLSTLALTGLRIINARSAGTSGGAVRVQGANLLVGTKRMPTCVERHHATLKHSTPKRRHATPRHATPVFVAHTLKKLHRKRLIVSSLTPCPNCYIAAVRLLHGDHPLL
jgi:hypothetical protein